MTQKKGRVKNETICCKEQRAGNPKSLQTVSTPGSMVPVVYLWSNNFHTLPFYPSMLEQMSLVLPDRMIIHDKFNTQVALLSSMHFKSFPIICICSDIIVHLLYSVLEG